MDEGAVAPSAFGSEGTKQQNAAKNFFRKNEASQYSQAERRAPTIDLVPAAYLWPEPTRRNEEEYLLKVLPMDLNDWRATVARDWTRIKDAPAKVRGDRVAGLAAVRQSAEALNYLERSLQMDRQVVLTAIAAHHRPREAFQRFQDFMLFPFMSPKINDRGVAGVRLRARFMSITVEVSLLSGKTATLQARLDERVETLKQRAQVALGGRKGGLLDASGVVLDGREEITNSWIQNGDSLTLHISSIEIQSSAQAFAAILGDASVVSWGDAATGGDSSAVQVQLQNVQQIQATGGAFAAVCSDGSVVTWGDARFGGDSSAAQGVLQNVQHIQATDDAFAAVCSDGSVVTWGLRGGDSAAVQGQLKNVQQIQAAAGAFAAILGDGSVVAWGHADFGGDCSAVQGQLKNVQQIQASRYGAFAAILGNRSVVTWGQADYGGDSSAVQGQLTNVQQIQASRAAFAAILGDGSVVTWGQADFGGDSSAVQGQLTNVQQIQASCAAFAAILGDGSVVVWGHADFGGDSSAVQGQLKNVQQIQVMLRLEATVVLCRMSLKLFTRRRRSFANWPVEVGARPGHEFLETATETVEDFAQLSNAAFDLGYSAMRLTEVVCRELVNSSASLAQGAASAWNSSADTQDQGRELVNSSASLAQGAASAWNSSADTQAARKLAFLGLAANAHETAQRSLAEDKKGSSEVSAAGSRRRKAPDSRSACDEGGLWQRSSSRAGARDRRSLTRPGDFRADSMSSTR
ncbi:hypothetical protein AK812_SmicGene29092 [Symbiodinium microadriaticum]|uniref:E3 ubiquitin-protein ligase HERC2 n=1 Tax=Symbiodinium microadriaticum TaxID=2951 RepID=A0A1Q9D2N9_SYMMI|nr:hypothetical protein AK812_SmicGene29092 [Symbiodinium microadriaticum]